jgi:hypothetical protein
MADLKNDAKNRGEFVVIEAKRFAITPKAPNSFREGFYEAEHYYKDVVEWVTIKLQEVSKAHRIFVYSLEAKSEHLMFWIDLAEASNNELLARREAKVKRSKQAGFQRSQPKSRAFSVKVDNEGAYQILHFTSDSSKEVRNVHVHYEVRVAMPERVLAKKEGNLAEAAPRFLTAKLLSKFNTPELMRRRATVIAETNAGHTKKSDDALESILMEFENLSF